MNRRPVFALLLTVVFASSLHARPGVVTTRDGQTYQGEVDERDPSVVIVVVKGIQTRIDRGRVASIDYEDKQKELNTRLSKLGPRDAAGRIALAREAMNQQQYVFARDVLEQARQIDPNNAEAVRLLETVQSQIRMERTRQRPPDAGAVAATEPAAATHPTAGGITLLRPAEINEIRQAELRLPDEPVRIRFERNVLRRFVDWAGRDKYPSFFNLNALQQAQLVLEQGPPEMRSDVMILNDPPPLLQYRQRIQPFVVLNCATATCHGGNDAKFKLITPADSEPASYTNFYRMVRYEKPMPGAGAAGVFGHGNPRMIDRQRPDESLLIQYALPGSIADYDHPDVRDYRPPLRNKVDPRYVMVMDWIGKSLKSVDPQYSFDPPPATTKASQPAGDVTAVQPVAPANPGPATRPARPAPPTPPAPVRRGQAGPPPPPPTF